MALPTGPAVTFLFTDIEGSTRLERAAGSAEWARLVARHDALLRAAIEGAGGIVVKTEGDAFFAAFDRPAAGVGAAVAAQRALASAGWPEGAAPRVRMGLHLGEGRLRHSQAPGDPEDYVGIDVNYTARIAAAGNGGQVVLSQALVGALGTGAEWMGAGAGDAAAGVELVDEGLRAVKDFEEPQRLHRLVVPGAADDDRSLRTIEAPSNLPADVTELVGRETEIERLRGELAESRIVTLTGPGGGGKTRLALAVAGGVRDRFPHGTWFVDLAAVRDPGLLETSIAVAIGLRESPNQPIGTVLHAHVRDRTLLLVLDNLEQLLPASASTVAALARGAGDLRFLITSRELLRIAGERGHAVPPLDAAAGTELFITRARALRPDLPLSDDDHAAIRAISERLGGLPLAIELAAARVRLLSPVLILERLTTSLDLGGGARDLPERQRTLRGAIAWSHDLLSAPERRLFRRLSVFAGGWTAATALQVTDPDGDLGMDVLDGLESLADKSLVRIEAAGADGRGGTEARFDIHPLLREFAQERLDESGERPAIEARHAATVVELAESGAKVMFGPKGPSVIRSLDREVHNLRAAVAWSLANDQPEVGLRIVGATWRWFQQRGRIREGRAYLAELLARPAGDVRVRISGLAAEGGLAYWMGDAAGATAAYEERLTLAESTGDPLLRADARYDIGFLSVLAGDPDGVRRHEQLALDLYGALGDEPGMSRARQALVVGRFLGGDWAGARDLEEENLATFEARGSRLQAADSLTLLAAIYYRLEDPARSWTSVLRGVRDFAENDNASGIARSLAMAAILQLDHGDAVFGARITGAALEVVRDKGVMLAPVRVLHLPDPGELTIERLGAERGQALLDEGAATPVEQIIEQILGTRILVSGAAVSGATATAQG